MKIKPLTTVLLLLIAIYSCCDGYHNHDNCSGAFTHLTKVDSTILFDSIVNYPSKRTVWNKQRFIVNDSLQLPDTSFFFLPLDVAADRSVFVSYNKSNPSDTLIIGHTMALKYNECSDYYFVAEEGEILKSTLDSVNFRKSSGCISLDIIL